MNGKQHVGENHQSVDDVKPDHRIPSARCEFENDPGDIPAEDEGKKKKTFADGVFHPDGFYDLGGPTGTETNHHDRFTNCTDVHVN